MPKLELDKVPVKTGSIYPAPYDREVVGRSSLRLGQAGGLTQFGANLVTLEPGAKSSMRHWHAAEDEFVMVTEGALVLIEDGGETAMGPGECAAFPAGNPDGHCLMNRTDAPARFLVIGTKAARDVATYSDINLMVTREGGKATFSRKDGTPYTDGADG